MDLFFDQVLIAFQGGNLIVMLIATIAGVLIGAIPGLTVNMAVALCVPLTVHLTLAPSLAMIFSIYVSGIFGGSVSAILVNTPGTPAAAATTLDGYEMAKQGKAGKALKMALLSSFTGGLISIVILVIVAQYLAVFALKFGPAERSALLFFALTIVGVLSGRSITKGLLAGGLGLLVATVGTDPMLAIPRFTFGFLELEDGFNFIPVLIGMFAFSEMLFQAENKMLTKFRLDETKLSTVKENNKLALADILLSWKTIIRSSFFGTFIGIMPGIGAAVACFLGYGEAKRVAKDPERFGKGTVEGVAAAEAANNAVSGATLIPLLALSIPGDTVTAILYGALLIQGVTPGPLIFQNHLDAVYLIYIMLILANLYMLVIGFSFMPLLKRVTEIPGRILFPIMFVFCTLGSYAIRMNTFDIMVMMGFGTIGYFMRKLTLPLAPMLIAFILATPFEEAIRQALVGSEGSLSIFLMKPIALGFFLLTIVSMVFTIKRGIKGQ
jgi:putative tricarboxylic transport membrane protein